MKNKLFTIISFLVISALLSVPAFADTLKVHYDHELSTVSVTYMSPYYQNHDVAISVVRIDETRSDNMIVYANQLKTDTHGVITLNDISVADNEFLKVCAAPLNGVYVSEEIVINGQYRKGLWSIAAQSTDAGEIANQLDTVCDLFGLKIGFEDDLNSIHDFCQKLAYTRENYDIGDESAGNNEKLKNVYYEIGLFTAAESINSASDKENSRKIYDVMFERIDDKDFLQAITTADEEVSELVFDEFVKAEKVINSDEDFYILIKDIYNGAKQANVLEKLKTLSHLSQVSEILTDDKTVLAMGIEELIKRYKKLESTSSVDKALFKKDFADRDVFIEALEKAIKKAESNEKDSEGSSSSSGKTSAAVGTIGTITPPKSEPEPTIYADLAGYDWAKSYIITLSEAGIISGKGNNIFDPAAPVLREEAAKMIVEAFGINASGVESFEDVTEDHWFAPYVAKAKNAGIVNGISETLFGAGLSITRQDATVMLYNALLREGVIDKAETMLTFADADYVSEYAKTAVGYMNKCGAIAGYEDGTFRPQNTITRAEFAVVLGRIFDTLKK